MLKSFFLVALRHLNKQKGYSALNIGGLALGMSCFLLILLWVRDELTYDAQFANAGRIYRVTEEYASDTGTLDFARTPPLLAPTLQQDFHEIENAVRFKATGGTVRYGEKQFVETNLCFADAEVLTTFSLPMLAGDPRSALAEPFHVVVSRSMAQRYFGDENPLGKSLVVDDSMQYTVSGVMADLPQNTHFTFEALLSSATLKSIVAPQWLNTWRTGLYYTYVLLRPRASAVSVQEKLPAFADRYINSRDTHCSLHLQALRDIHLYSHLRGEMKASGNPASVYMFSIVGLLVLVVACINFMNLATALSTRRVKEVGLRKVVGAARAGIVKQSLFESMLASFIALLVAFVVVESALPLFNTLAEKKLGLNTFAPWQYVLFGLGFAVITGSGAGGYPALVLSRYGPIGLLRGGRSSGTGALSLRRTLVIVQFVVSVVLIVGTMVVARQFAFMRSHDLGFNDEQMIVMPFLWDKRVQGRYEALKDELLRLPGITGVTASGDIPGRMSTTLTFRAERMTDSYQGSMAALIVDPDFLTTYGIRLVAGHNFSAVEPLDSLGAILLNEKAVKEIGWGSPEEAIGKRFTLQQMNGVVIGVVKDFNVASLHQAIEPLAMAVWPDWFGYVSIRINDSHVEHVIPNIERTWTRVLPRQPFRYVFLDEDFDRQYRAEQRLQDLFRIASGVAIALACLGLLSITAFNVEQRTKEIGVRKVLGASIPRIVFMLSKESIVLVLAATVFASPVAYYAMNAWLQNFAYRIHPEATTFLVANIGVLAIAMMTVGYQAIKAAVRNPVEALRHE